MTTDTAVSSTAPLRRNRRYLTWLISDTSKGLAAALFAFAVPLLTLMVTNDPARAGIVGAAGLAVRAVTTLAGGVLADRHRRIALMTLGSVIGVMIAGGFTVLALTDALTFLALLIVAVLLAARTGLFDVAGESALKEVVPDGAMGRAQAANQGRDAALQLAGGPLGGALLAAGAWVVAVVMTACHLVAAITAWRLGRSAPDPGATRTGTGPDPTHPAHPADPPAPEAVSGPAPNALAELRAGFAWLLSRTDLRGVLVVSTIINLGFNAALATVIYALQQDGHSPAAIGWVSAGAGAAMLLGAVAAPMLVSRVRAGVLTIVGLTIAAAGAYTLALVDSVWAITAVLAVSVLGVPALNAALMGYFMVATPTELLGRANSASMVLGIGAMPLAPLIAGFGLAWVGREATIAVCAGLCAVAALLALANRGLRALPAESGWTAHAAQFDVSGAVATPDR
ncbi:MFS transporter [Occultella glacieicola]|uniref:MFS transporter n=1 Tax=Occultella glacieicola TaxID=2518684 RepID=A0ABY2E5Y1_9MICO|nr:MFS transporter [Occultella glacieicola]TDE91633.1 MFS transporter [Occultella glacieicola]